MTVEQVQFIFDSVFTLVLTCYVIGMGIGLIIKILKDAF